MWSGGDSQFRRGLGLALVGIAFLLGAIFFAEVTVANEIGARGSGYGTSFMGAVLAMVGGGILSLVGGAMIASHPPVPSYPPAYPPQYPRRT